MHQVLALVAALGVDHVAALVVAEGMQALLHGDVELDVLRAQLFVHPAHAGLAHLGGLFVRAVVAEAQQRALGVQRNHDEGAEELGEREGIEGVVRPHADVEEALAGVRLGLEFHPVGFAGLEVGRGYVGPPVVAPGQAIALEVDQLGQVDVAGAGQFEVIALDGVVHDHLPVGRHDHVLLLDQAHAFEVGEDPVHFLVGAGEQLVQGRRIGVEVEVDEATHFLHPHLRDVELLHLEILHALATRRAAQAAVHLVAPGVVGATHHPAGGAAASLQQAVATVLADVVESADLALHAARHHDALVE
ncbi:hypothetical protein D9M68_671710 [compost metagenome]